MTRKRALVVDDSKSARVILSRMLEKYDLDVDMAESAEQAIEYLGTHRPDAIFMDHLMPGMDGLQAVQVIKGNPDTATIPIMMYTSQEGELYVGQARALGAMGVLPKQVRPVDVSRVLYELRLLPERRDLAEAALAPLVAVTSDSAAAPAAPVAGASAAAAPAADAPAAGAPTSASAAAATPFGTVAVTPASAAATAGATPSPEALRRLETVVKDQAADLRRFIVASLDSFAARVVSDVRHAAPPPPAEPLAAAPPARRTPWLPATLVAGVCALAFAGAWIAARNDAERARAEVAALTAANRDLNNARQELAQTVKDLTAAVGAAATSANAPAAAAAATAATAPGAGAPSGAAPRVEPVPYGELPFDRGRLDALREVLMKLEAQNFHGVVKVTSTTGLFCLTGNAGDGYAPANPSLPVAKCDLVGNPFAESLTAQQRESLAFANLVAGVRQRTAGAISVSVENAAGKPAVSYPQRSDTLTAGEWNRAAAANNRVEILAEPGAAR